MLPLEAIVGTTAKMTVGNYRGAGSGGEDAEQASVDRDRHSTARVADDVEARSRRIRRRVVLAREQSTAWSQVDQELDQVRDYGAEDPAAWFGCSSRAELS